MNPESPDFGKKESILPSAKPVIVYIDNIGEEENYQKALSFVLKNDHKCQVLEYSCTEYLCKNRQLQELSDRGVLMMFIIKEEGYYKDHFPGFPHDIIQYVHANYSANLPINIIPYRDSKRYQEIIDNKLIFSYGYSDHELLELVKNTKENFKLPQPNFYGVETHDDKCLLLFQLQQSYYQNYLKEGNENGQIGVPNEHEQTISQAIRIHQMPGEVVKEIFDDVLIRTIPEFQQVEEQKYNEERRRVKIMTDQERQNFQTNLWRAEGLEPEVNSFYVKCISKGYEINGFAIDPETLEFVITGHGKHDLARNILSYRLEAIEGIRGNRSCFLDSHDELRYKLYDQTIKGLIFNKIEGFSVPILQLDNFYISNPCSKRIITFLNRQQKFIPIDYNCNLIE